MGEIEICWLATERQPSFLTTVAHWEQFRAYNVLVQKACTCKILY